jgi:hypothetical protein
MELLQRQAATGDGVGTGRSIEGAVSSDVREGCVHFKYWSRDPLLKTTGVRTKCNLRSLEMWLNTRASFIFGWRVCVCWSSLPTWKFASFEMAGAPKWKYLECKYLKWPETCAGKIPSARDDTILDQSISRKEPVFHDHMVFFKEVGPGSQRTKKIASRLSAFGQLRCQTCPYQTRPFLFHYQFSSRASFRPSLQPSWSPFIFCFYFIIRFQSGSYSIFKMGTCCWLPA